MCHVGPPPDVHLTLVEPHELPEGQDWMFLELGGEIHSMLSKEASGESMVRGLKVVAGLVAEMKERKRQANMGGDESGPTTLPFPPMLIS